MEDWEMGEDYELEEDSSIHDWGSKKHEYKRRTKDGVKHKAGNVGGHYKDYEMNEDSGAIEDNYFNSIKGIRTADVYNESRIGRLVRNELIEAQAKDAKKWIQGAVKRPGALRKKLGVKKGDKISLAKINQEMRKIKSSDTNKKKPGVQGLSKAKARTYRQLNLAKTLRGLSKKKHAKESRKWVKK